MSSLHSSQYTFQANTVVQMGKTPANVDINTTVLTHIAGRPNSMSVRGTYFRPLTYQPHVASVPPIKVPANYGTDSSGMPIPAERFPNRSPDGSTGLRDIKNFIPSAYLRPRFDHRCHRFVYQISFSPFPTHRENDRFAFESSAQGLLLSLGKGIIYPSASFFY